MTHAWIAKDPKGRLMIETARATRRGAIGALEAIEGWRTDYDMPAMRRLGWRVVKVELREVD